MRSKASAGGGATGDVYCNGQSRRNKVGKATCWGKSDRPARGARFHFH